MAIPDFGAFIQLSAIGFNLDKPRHAGTPVNENPKPSAARLWILAASIFRRFESYRAANR
jgi:hypothetical protein